MAGFTGVLDLQGALGSAPPGAGGGYRSALELCGLWITGGSVEVVEDRTDQLGGKRGDEDARRQVMRELEVVRAKNRMARELGISPDEIPATSEPDHSLELILLLSEA